MRGRQGSTGKPTAGRPNSIRPDAQVNRVKHVPASFPTQAAGAARFAHRLAPGSAGGSVCACAPALAEGGSWPASPKQSTDWQPEGWGSPPRCKAEHRGGGGLTLMVHGLCIHRGRQGERFFCIGSGEGRERRERSWKIIPREKGRGASILILVGFSREMFLLLSDCI